MTGIISVLDALGEEFVQLVFLSPLAAFFIMLLFFTGIGLAYGILIHYSVFKKLSEQTIKSWMIKLSIYNFIASIFVFIYLIDAGSTRSNLGAGISLVLDLYYSIILFPLYICCFILYTKALWKEQRRVISSLLLINISLVFLGCWGHILLILALRYSV